MASLTEAEQLALLKQIWDSELDYMEIKARAESLQALPERTPEQESELQSYLTKLAHDREVISSWVKALKTGGVPNIKKAENLLIRTGTMDTMKAAEQWEIDQLTTSWNNYVVWYEAELIRLREDGIDTAEVERDYANGYADYQRTLAVRIARINLLTNLRDSLSAWNDLL